MASTCVHLGRRQTGREWQHSGAAALGCVNLGMLFINIAAPSKQLPGVQCAGFSVPWSQVLCPC